LIIPQKIVGLFMVFLVRFGGSWAFSSTNLSQADARARAQGLRADALHADLLRECLTRMEDFTTQELAIVTGLLDTSHVG